MVKIIILLVICILFLFGAYTVLSQRGIDSATREVDRPVREEMEEKTRITPKPPVIEEEEEEGEEECEKKIVVPGDENADAGETPGVKIIEAPYVTEATTATQEIK